MNTKQGQSGAALPLGIVIQHPVSPEPHPSISAFIWGGKIAPVPSLPYGRSKS